MLHKLYLHTYSVECFANFMPKPNFVLFVNIILNFNKITVKQRNYIFFLAQQSRNYQFLRNCANLKNICITNFISSQFWWTADCGFNGMKQIFIQSFVHVDPHINHIYIYNLNVCQQSLSTNFAISPVKGFCLVRKMQECTAEFSN